MTATTTVKVIDFQIGPKNARKFGGHYDSATKTWTVPSKAFSERPPRFYGFEEVAEGPRPADSSLPALTGTPKQIEWAGTIRTRLLATVETTIAALPAPVSEADHSAKAGIETLIATLKSETRAAWWIDHRGQGAKQLLTASH